MRIISLTISEEGVHTLIIQEKLQKAILGSICPAVRPCISDCFSFQI
jgi:hypothetical protein